MIPPRPPLPARRRVFAAWWKGLRYDLNPLHLRQTINKYSRFVSVLAVLFILALGYFWWKSLFSAPTFRLPLPDQCPLLPPSTMIARTCDPRLYAYNVVVYRQLAATQAHDPHMESLYNQLGFSAQQAGLTKDAVKWYRRYLQLFPHSRKAWVVRAELAGLEAQQGRKK